MNIIKKFLIIILCTVGNMSIQGMDPNIDIKDRNGDTQLHRALKEKNPYDEIKRLLDQGADPNIPDSKDLTILNHIVSSPAYDTNLTKLLLSYSKTNPNRQGLNGHTPLHNAIIFYARSGLKAVEHIKLLIADKRTDPNIRSTDTYSHLYCAVLTRQELDLITLLLSNTRINVNSIEGYEQNTALHLAVNYEQPDIVKVLLEHGANPMIKSRYDETPLDLLERNEKKHIIKDSAAAQEIKKLLKNHPTPLDEKNNDSNDDDDVLDNDDETTPAHNNTIPDLDRNTMFKIADIKNNPQLLEQYCPQEMAAVKNLFSQKEELIWREENLVNEIEKYAGNDGMISQRVIQEIVRHRIRGFCKVFIGSSEPDFMENWKFDESIQPTFKDNNPVKDPRQLQPIPNHNQVPPLKPTTHNFSINHLLIGTSIITAATIGVYLIYKKYRTHHSSEGARVGQAKKIDAKKQEPVTRKHIG